MKENLPVWGLSFQEQLFINALFGLVALVAVIYAVHVARQEKTRYPYFLLVGAGLATAWEAFADVYGQCIFPEIDQITWVELIGRKIPLYMGFCYIFYVTAPVLWLIRRLQAGITVAQWWKYYGVAVVLVATFELLPIHLDWWRYYGENQVFVVLGYPAWWWFVNAQAVFVISAMLHLLRRSGVLSENHSFLLIPLVPMLTWCAGGSAAMPVFATLTSTADVRIITAACILSTLLSFMNIWITSRLVIRRADRFAASQ